MLTQQQRDEFAATGLLRLPQSIPTAEAQRMADRIQEHLASEESIRRNADAAWKAEHPTGMQPLNRAGAFDAVATGSVPLALDDLWGAESWHRPRHWGRPLVTNSVPGVEWDVPTTGWHLDIAADRLGEPPIITVFVILAPLRPYGGGTLLVTGSHRLVRRYDAEIRQGRYLNRTCRRVLGTRHSWLAELWAAEPDPDIDRRHRFLQEGAVLDEIPVRVVELTGEPGDAFLMRADLFHCSAPNGRIEPRMMLVKSCVPSP